MDILYSILPWIQVILSVILVTLILFQQSDAGLGSSFGGGDGSATFNTKRGLEKTIFIATIVVAILWVLTDILTLFV